MFSNDDRFFSFLRSIVKKMHKLGDMELIRFGLTHAEMRSLLMIYEDDGCRQDSLVVGLGVDRTNVGRALKKLENLGYVSRVKDENDSRAYRVFITEKGESIKSKMLEIKSDIEKLAMADVTAEEFAVAAEILAKIDRSLGDGFRGE